MVSILSGGYVHSFKPLLECSTELIGLLANVSGMDAFLTGILN